MNINLNIARKFYVVEVFEKKSENKIFFIFKIKIYQAELELY